MVIESTEYSRDILPSQDASSLVIPLVNKRTWYPSCMQSHVCHLKLFVESIRHSCEFRHHQTAPLEVDMPEVWLVPIEYEWFGAEELSVELSDESGELSMGVRGRIRFGVSICDGGLEEVDLSL